jgi:RNA polymerase sigma factor (sigma-70 family)
VPYLKRAVANRCIDIMRKRRDVLTEAVPERHYEEPGFLRHEQTRRFYDLVQQLPERQREVLVLRFTADLDDAAIAKILGITVNTVRSQAQHALGKLRASDSVTARTSPSRKEES